MGSFVGVVVGTVLKFERSMLGLLRTTSGFPLQRLSHGSQRVNLLDPVTVGLVERPFRSLRTAEKGVRSGVPAEDMLGR